MINATTTDKGTWPAGSQWRKNPIPMCNCDIGTGCGGKEETADAAAMFPAELPAWLSGAAEGDEGGKQCKEVVREQCGDKTGYNTCLKCGNKSSCTAARLELTRSRKHPPARLSRA